MILAKLNSPRCKLNPINHWLVIDSVTIGSVVLVGCWENNFGSRAWYGGWVRLHNISLTRHATFMSLGPKRALLHQCEFSDNTNLNVCRLRVSGCSHAVYRKVVAVVASVVIITMFQWCVVRRIWSYGFLQVQIWLMDMFTQLYIMAVHTIQNRWQINVCI